MLKKLLKRNKEEKSKKINVEDIKSKKIFKKSNFRQTITPKHINPNPMNHVSIVNAKEVCCRTFYVCDFPRNATFAYTFEPIFKNKNTAVSAFINPLVDGKSVKELNDVIDELDTERLMVEGKNRNRSRRLFKKMSEAEKLRDDVDSGENAMYDIAFLVTLYAENEEQLDKYTDDLIKECKRTGLELTSCYGYQVEAFKANTPLNKVDSKLLKYHQFDRYSASTLFHYTTGDFHHKKGMIIGRHVFTGRHATFDPYDPSLNGFNIVFAATTRAGKSSTVKKFILVYEPLDYEFISLDPEGEYGRIADLIGGVNIVISPTSNTIINPFDIDIEFEKDETTGKEIPRLKVAEKVTDVTHILSTMARGVTGANSSSGAQMGFNEITLGIIQEAVAEEYEDFGIKEDDLESIYIKDGISEGKLTSGKKKKEMPTIGSWYERIVKKAKKYSTHANYSWHYDYLVMVMRKYVRNYNGRRGSMSYFDGQSTVQIKEGIPFINIDISKLNETFERPLAMQIVLNMMWEKYIKKNSEDITKAKKKVAIFDEMWMMLPFPEARKFLQNLFRRAGKRNVVGVVSTQRLKDFFEYSDAQSIITNAATKFIGRQDKSEIAEVQQLLGLNDSVMKYLSSVPKGQFYVRSGEHEGYIQIDRLKIEELYLSTDANELERLWKEKQENENKKEVV